MITLPMSRGREKFNKTPPANNVNVARIWKDKIGGKKLQKAMKEYDN